jgi:hypothetical protein
LFSNDHSCLFADLYNTIKRRLFAYWTSMRFISYLIGARLSWAGRFDEVAGSHAVEETLTNTRCRCKCRCTKKDKRLY